MPTRRCNHLRTLWGRDYLPADPGPRQEDPDERHRSRIRREAGELTHRIVHFVFNAARGLECVRSCTVKPGACDEVQVTGRGHSGGSVELMAPHTICPCVRVSAGRPGCLCGSASLGGVSRVSRLWRRRVSLYAFPDRHHQTGDVARPVRPIGDQFSPPPVELFDSFEQMGKKGRKFTLSAKENPKRYHAYVQGNPLWRELYKWIRGREFIYGALDNVAATRSTWAFAMCHRTCARCGRPAR